MKIAVVEDEKGHRDLLAAYLDRWGREENRAITVSSFENAESFWFWYEEQRDFDILFVDIQMSGMNGMELARKVRERDKDVVIVFTTGITDYLEEGYEVEALHYLLKPLSEEKVRSCLEKAVQRRKRKKFVTLHTEGGTLKISEESINYAEARGHGCAIGIMTGAGLPAAGSSIASDSGRGMEENVLLVKESLSELEKFFGGGEFVKCHRSYLCHISNVHHIGKEEIFFDDGSSIPVSRRLYQQVNQSFIAYFRREVCNSEIGKGFGYRWEVP